MAIEAVIFDRDGVLAFFDNGAIVDFFTRLLPISIPQMRPHWDAHGAEHGWPRSLAEEKLFFAAYWWRLARAYDLPAETVSTLDAWNYLGVMRPFDDARPLMDWLRQRGIKIGVLSNFSLASLEPSLEALGLDEFVDVACAASVIGVSKPEAAAFHITADRLGVAPERCLMIDDRPEHVQGARAAGMQALLLDRDGQASADEPAIRSLAEVGAFVQELSGASRPR